MTADGNSGSPQPTVTLAELYLAQGHRREAAALLQRVLAADPDNDRARAGLEGLGLLAESGTSRRAFSEERRSIAGV